MCMISVPADSAPQPRSERVAATKRGAALLRVAASTCVLGASAVPGASVHLPRGAAETGSRAASDATSRPKRPCISIDDDGEGEGDGEGTDGVAVGHQGKAGSTTGTHARQREPFGAHRAGGKVRTHTKKYNPTFPPHTHTPHSTPHSPLHDTQGTRRPGRGR